MSGRLFGIGVGPGDPELVTIKAQRLIDACPVVAYPVARHGNSVARSVAAPYIRADHIELVLQYPVTTEQTDHPGGYECALSEFYDQAAEAIAAHLDAGRDVAVLCEGDPFFYGSYMYVHDRLAHRYPTEVIPGVTSFSAAAAAAGRPLVRRDDVLTVLPGTLPAEVLAARLRSTDAAVLMKLGRTFGTVRQAIETSGNLDAGIYVERASSEREVVKPLADVDGVVPYMSLVLVPARDRAAVPHERGRVAVVGLGPAGPDWLTPEAQGELAAAEYVVGYGPYVDRVPLRRGQERHSSDNRVEMDRAREALELAAAGARVAVVSSGDPGIFAMASAVFEAIDGDQERFAAVDVHVVPGVSAMQAAAARVGAPLGHDFCVVSLSDQRKPWEVIEERLRAAAEADMVMAFYNPASRTRRVQLERAVEVLSEYRDPETVVIVARAVGTDQEKIDVVTLERFSLEVVDMRTLVIVGSSRTRVIPGTPPRVYTPRTYVPEARNLAQVTASSTE
jgi:precorrin-2 C20-methyltransferase / precorrin-3B C17-methyltransferase